VRENRDYRRFEEILVVKPVAIRSPRRFEMDILLMKSSQLKTQGGVITAVFDMNNWNVLAKATDRFLNTYCLWCRF
jgi:hypothetical protein